MGQEIRQKLFVRKLKEHGVMTADNKILVADLDLSFMDLSNLSMEGVVFNKVKFNGANLYGTHIKDARFVNCEFIGADLVHCKFENVCMKLTILACTDCKSLHMHTVVIENSVIDRCKLEYASLNSVVFREVEFNRTYTKEAIHTEVDYVNCSCTRRTRFPLGFIGRRKKHHELGSTWLDRILERYPLAVNFAFAFTLFGLGLASWGWITVCMYLTTP